MKLLDLDLGDKVPEEFVAVVEIPKNSRVKYEVDKDTGLISVDRFLSSTLVYPQNYGFIPNTHWEDGDPLDVVIISYEQLLPGSIVKVRPVALLKMLDGGDPDDKVIAVPVKDPRFKEIKGLEDIPEHLIKELQFFFDNYKTLEGKKTKVTAIEGADKAKKAVLIGIDNYKKIKNQ